MSLAEMEAEFKRVVGAKKIIWLKQGLYEDDQTTTGILKNAAGEPLYNLLTTNGHTDEYVRFVNPSTVLLAAIDSADLTDPVARENLKRLKINEDILSKATDQDGTPLTILKMPLPRLIVKEMRPEDEVYKIISQLTYADGSKFPVGKPVKGIAAASYLNFLIANDVVLVAAYGGENRDRDLAAQKVLQTVFPNKKILPLDVLAVNLGGGGIHCITRNQPRL
jgi:agmatine deiminase